MTNLTPLETAALSAIICSEYRSCPDLDEPVWTFSVVDALGRENGMSEQAAGGVISSLVKKGLAKVQDPDPRDRDGDSIIWLTDEGISAAAGCGLRAASF
jgi:hypothetical protein